jgi:hypothetical protein
VNDRSRGHPSEPPLPDKVIAIHEALKAARIPHAIGGALALAYYAEPRATIDIDLNVFVSPKQWENVIGALTPLGVDAGGLEAEALLRDGQCRLWWSQNPIDLFFTNEPFHEAMSKRTRRLPFAGETLPFLAPEDLVVCKALFDRPKDWVDIEQILLSTEGLDFADVETWLERMAGKDDPRLKRLAELKTS